MKLKTKNLAMLSALIAIAMILSYVESLIPPLVAVPGAKIGLSNIATVFALYTLGRREAVTVSLVRVLLSALLFGNTVSLFYSVMGAILALLLMIVFYVIGIFSPIGVSVLGGVAHNAGQIIAASIVLDSEAVTVYMIPLVITGTVAGVLVGICAGVLVTRVGKYLKL